MLRLRCLVVIGVVALAASTVVAGPAVAAKGGNSDNAHACQQGGHQSLLEAETGNPFKNAGDCVNDGAQGSPPFGTAGKAACGDIDGSFVIEFIREPPARIEWECEYTPNPPPPAPMDSNTLALNNACSADVDGGSGVFQAEQSNDQWFGICAEFALGSAPFGTAGKAACGDVNGRFMLRTAPTAWQCKFDPTAFPDGTANLAAACATDTNNSTARRFFTEQVPPILAAICIPPPPT
jgi:hypothetical protein